MSHATRSLEPVGLIILVTGAGGVLGRVLVALLVEGMNSRRGERPFALTGVPVTGKSYLHSATPS